MSSITRSRPAQRFGMKGPAAEAWLRERGFAVPDTPNTIATWNTETGDACRCLRLGYTEFLVEQEGAPASSLTASADTHGAYLLLRSDCSLVLHGPAWPDALAQVCSFDLRRFDAEPDMVVMTLLAGIAVTLVREPAADGGQPALRLWCDASYARYLQESLHALLPETTPDPGGPR